MVSSEPQLQAAPVVVEERVVGPRHGGAGGQQDQRIDERQAPGVERAVEGVAGLGRPLPAGQGVALHHAVDFLARLHRAVGHGDVDGIDGGREQRGVEVGPEPGDEEHHLRGDEQDHAVAQVQLNDRRVVAAVRFLDDVAPPHEHGEHQPEHADEEHRGALEPEQALRAAHGAHPDDEADRRHEGGRGADRRPRARVHQVIIVVLGVRVGHASCSLDPFCRGGAETNIDLFYPGGPVRDTAAGAAGALPSGLAARPGCGGATG